ncbi:MAG: hypothetical protein GXO27_03195 [Chlorobi bacterium]|nr:hypothetical protein [Chlorobiota bacterium]
MKKIYFITFILLIGCGRKDSQKNSPTSEAAPSSARVSTRPPSYELDTAYMQWTAFKTTAKIPVEGTFTQTRWDLKRRVNRPEEFVERAYFKTLTSSVHTGNPERDRTIFEGLFARMIEGKIIEARTASLDTASQTVRIAIRMNGKEVLVPFKYRITGDTLLTAEGSVDLLKDFGAAGPFQSLHEACKDQHTGEDGISKTWTDVDLKAFIKYHQIHE